MIPVGSVTSMDFKPCCKAWGSIPSNSYMHSPDCPELRRIALARAPLTMGEEIARAVPSILIDRDQDWVDEVCTYRNLAIALGAKPEQMLNSYDRGLCAQKLVDSSEAGNPSELLELEDRAEKAESALAEAKAEIELLTQDRDGWIKRGHKAENDLREQTFDAANRVKTLENLLARITPVKGATWPGGDYKLIVPAWWINEARAALASPSEPASEAVECGVCGDPTFRPGGYCSREHEKQGKP